MNEETDELTPELNYRFTIIEAIDFLKLSQNEIFTKLVNVAMAGEYSDFISDDGDVIPSDISYFQKCDDQNVQVLIKYFERIQETINYLMNVNNIQDDELGIRIEYTD